MIPELAQHSEKLVYFFHIVNERGIQPASRKLGLSAPTLSHSMKELEKVVGHSLFSRNQRGMVATDAGHRLYEFCKKYFKEMEEVQLQLHDLTLRSKRRIKIGTFTSIAMYFWPLLQQELTKDKSLSIVMTTNRSRDIQESLLRGNVDMAITVECLTHAHIVNHELYTDTYSYYASSQLRLDDDWPSRHVLFYIPDAIDSEGRTLRQWVHSSYVSFKEEFELDSFEVIAEFIKNGHGVAILPNRVALKSGKNLKKVKLDSVPMNFGSHKFYLSYRNDLELSQKQLNMILNSAKMAAAKMKVPTPKGGS